MKKLNLSLIVLLSVILLPLPFEVNTANAHGWKKYKKASKESDGAALVEKNGKWYHRSCWFRVLSDKHSHDVNGKKNRNCG